MVLTKERKEELLLQKKERDRERTKGIAQRKRMNMVLKNLADQKLKKETLVKI